MEHDGEIYKSDFSAHVEVNIMPHAYNVLYWLTEEELKQGKKPDGVATKHMKHWDARMWQEKN